METTVQRVPPGGVDQLGLRRVLGNYLTGVAVVAARDEDAYVGMTINSFASVSLDPPLVLFCAATASRTKRRIVASGAFAVTFLARDQREIAARFAAPVANRFEGVRVLAGWTGSPIVESGLGFVDCRIARWVECGDHTIVVGEVLEAGSLVEGEPLAFFQGRYRSLDGSA